jgi:tripartite-type tricarboxylate transporter receptor subunit TctC
MGERFMTPAEFQQFMSDDIHKWAKVIRDANVKAG